MFKDDCAVYCIRQLSTGRRYVGGSAKLNERWGRHRRDLLRGTHHCAPLQAAFNGSTPDDFAFEVLERCSPADVRRKEQQLLEQLIPADFNVAVDAVAGDMLSRHPRKAEIIAARLKTQRAWIDKMSRAERKSRWSKPGRRNGMYGRTHAPAVKAALAARMRGQPSTFKGKRHSACARALQSAAARQRIGPKNAFFGHRHSAATKEKISEANRGKLPPNTLAVLADGVRYVSLTEAARQLGVSTGTIFFRIRSPNFDYQYCQ